MAFPGAGAAALSDTSMTNPNAAGTDPSFWLRAALVMSVATLAGSLLLSLGLDLKACALCFYQRTFAMSLVSVLGMGLLTGAGRATRLGLLALPLATAGLGVALFHVFLEINGTLECPRGLFGLGTAPQQSLGMFLVLFVLLLGDALSKPVTNGGPWPALAGALVLGGLLAVGSWIANPPLPAAPKEPYANPIPATCRPPVRTS
jgi:disulfide bond formation protein DsbB